MYCTVCTVVKSKGKILQNFVAFSEYMNFSSTDLLHFHEIILQEPDMRFNCLPVRHQMSYRNAEKWYKWVYACLKKSPRKSDPVQMWLWSKIMFYPTNRLLFQPNWIRETTLRAKKYSWLWNFTEKINSHMASEKSKSLFFNRLVLLSNDFHIKSKFQKNSVNICLSSNKMSSEFFRTLVRKSRWPRIFFFWVLEGLWSELYFIRQTSDYFPQIV